MVAHRWSAWLLLHVPLLAVVFQYFHEVYMIAFVHTLAAFNYSPIVTQSTPTGGVMTGGPMRPSTGGITPAIAAKRTEAAKPAGIRYGHVQRAA